MKNLLLLTLLLTFSVSLSSCRQEDDGTEAYLKEYRHYQPVVSYYMGTVEKELSDTIKKEVDRLVDFLPYQSCIYCPNKGLGLSLVAHRKALLWIADNHFKGKDSRLKYIFHSMFRWLYHDAYILLLEELDIKKGDEWNDKVNQFNNLPMENMFDKYLEVEFGEK